MQTTASDGDASRKRHFTIRSEFGGARRWRSRKSRPCDACRKRKSACIIEDRPPCLFCRSRGLVCRAINEAGRSRPSNGHSVDDENQLVEPPRPPSESNPGRHHGTASQHSCSNLDRDQPLLSPATSVNSGYAQEVATRARTSSNAGDRVPCLEPSIPAQGDLTPRTAHLMGLAAEQDTHLLASLRSFVLDELDQVSGEIVQVHAGKVASGQPPIHFCVLHDAFMPWDNQIRHDASQMIEAKVAPYGPDLVRLYFKHVHPVYCVVSKVRFLRAYRVDKLSIPASLRGVMYGLAAVFWRQDARLSRMSCPFEQYELFHAAQASLERELDAPNLWKLQACLLMLHEQPAHNHTFQTPRTWTLSAQAVACAQMTGLHRDPTDWNIDPWEKSLRKKLWWAAYMTDTWSSVSHGNPPHIYKGSYTTSQLDMEDLRFDEDVPDDLLDMVDAQSPRFDVSTAARFIELVRLTQTLHDLLDTSFTDQSYQAAMLDNASHEKKLLRIQHELQSWHSLIPQCVTMKFASKTQGFQNNGPLYLSYFATQVLLFRALMTPASMAAKRNPRSSLRRYFSKAMDQIDGFLEFMNEITQQGLQAFWGRHARAQLMLVGNFLELLFLLSSNPNEVCATYEHLERFHDSLQRLTDLADEDTMTLIRPVAIRIDTFFTQAAQMMTESSTMGSGPEPGILDSTT